MKCMFKQLCLPILALLVLGFSSCSSTKHIDIENDALESKYNTSLDLWNKQKAENGGNYKYSTSYASVFGYRSRTEITVKNNKVVGRKFYETEQGSQDLKLVFEEDESTINSVPDRGTAVTMDQIYETCGETSLTKDEYYDAGEGEKIEANVLTFETDVKGILSNCGYREAMCADDCYRGTYIADFKWLK
ncbi:MAG: hypothetical protein AAFV80_13580 [Bacteroidota bacterium]